MTSSQENVNSVVAYCRDYLRVSAAMGMMMFLFSLPAFFLLLTVTPSWAGYGVISLAVIALIGAGRHLLPETEDEERLERKLDEMTEGMSRYEEILFVVGSYAIIAGGVTAVLLTSATLAGILGHSGYPLVAIAFAFLVPYADSLVANETDASLSKFGMQVAYYAITAVGVLGGLRTEPFRQTVRNGDVVY